MEPHRVLYVFSLLHNSLFILDPVLFWSFFISSFYHNELCKHFRFLFTTSSCSHMSHVVTCSWTCPPALCPLVFATRLSVWSWVVLSWESWSPLSVVEFHFLGALLSRSFLGKAPWHISFLGIHVFGNNFYHFGWSQNLEGVGHCLLAFDSVAKSRVVVCG